MNTILRGPTTRQFWTIARRVPGVAHFFGRCYACQAPVTEQQPRCAQCGSTPPESIDRNQFGLGEVVRVTPPADAKPDLASFIDDSSTLLVRVAPTVVPADLPARAPRPFVPAAVSVVVRQEPAPAPQPARPPVAAENAARSALSPAHVGLASRARALERTNRLLFGLAAISFAVAVVLVLVIVGLGEKHQAETEAKVTEAIRSVRSEFERRAPVVIPPPAELPPMPNAPTTQLPPR